MRNYRIIIITVLIFIIIFIIGHISNRQYSAQPIKETTIEKPQSSEIMAKQAYSNSKHNFSISVPKGWEIDEGFFGTVVSLKNPKPDYEDEYPFNAGINIFTESSEGTDLQTYEGSGDKLWRAVLPNTRIEDTIKDINGRQVKITSELFTLREIFHVKVLQWITIKDGQAYTLTAFTLESTWDQYKDIIESSLLSFRFNNEDGFKSD